MDPNARITDVGPGSTGKRPRTLVILSPGFPKDESDSTCLPAQQLFVSALNRCFPTLQVVILAFEYPFSKEPYRWHGNLVIPFDGWNKGRLNKVLVWTKAWNTLNGLRHDRDVLGLLSFWCTACSLVGTWYGRRKDLPHFTWILGQDARRNRYIRFIRPRPEHLVAMSDSLATEFRANYGILPRHIVTNGIDAAQYPRPARDASARDIDVLGVGSLIPLKQYDLFLAVIRQMADRRPDIRSVICGKGPEEDRLRELIRKERLEDKVELAGERPHDEVLRLMQRSRVFLHTSSYEGFSTVCLEALYAGAHVLSLVKPTPLPVKHWQVADRWQDMAGLALGILQDPAPDHSPVLLYTMDDSARGMMRLFE
ncbi:MAG: glycosyltransferase family 4 protein [Bacteroidota bacterium]|nr:glycosyltransferase family 4 protein [Bacteroidota bacterium]MDP4252542.1 glycosyltransferase family 4 protein [Bacteroidota bacterium]MDP4257822.1 glycosyltransferase family 4 protein [Bacteroidota bacterium]